MINTFGVHSLKYLNNISVWWHAVGTVSLVIAILVKAPTHQSGSYVFTQFIDGTGVDGPGWSERASSAYVVVVGILMAQYTLTGASALWDASHVPSPNWTACLILHLEYLKGLTLARM